MSHACVGYPMVNATRVHVDIGDMHTDDADIIKKAFTFTTLPLTFVLSLGPCIAV